MSRIPVDNDFLITEALTTEGDYAVFYDEAGGVTAVWMVLPNCGLSRILGPASTEDGAKWEITEDGDGRVSATPSIECRMQLADGERYWHGYLTNGELVSV